VNLNIVADKVRRALTPEEVFGPVAAAEEINDAYRKLAPHVHPDRFSGPEVAVATEAFRRLTDLKAEAERRFAAGVYGKPIKLEPTPAPAPPRVVKVGKKEYALGDVLARGELADIYSADDRLVLKLARSAKDNDLLENESRVLGALRPPKAKREGFMRYLPKLHDSFSLKSAKSTRRANVLQRYPEHVSLAHVRARKPHGLDFRDAAWIMRRSLELLGHLHRAGYVHGAVLPEHLLVHPTEHGAKLIDWCYAVPLKSAPRLKAISGDRRDFYPPEVFAKQAATPAIDLFMLGKVALFLMNDGTPPRVRRFFDAFLLPSAARRPSDAWALHDEYSELLRSLCGPPTYRPLVL
jgi:serine/threonine protein kinase